MEQTTPRYKPQEFIEALIPMWVTDQAGLDTCLPVGTQVLICEVTDEYYKVMWNSEYFYADFVDLDTYGEKVNGL